MKKFVARISSNVFCKKVTSSSFQQQMIPSIFSSHITNMKYNFHNNILLNEQTSFTEQLAALPDPSTLNIKPRRKKTIPEVPRNKTRQTWRDRPKITPKFLDTCKSVTYRQVHIQQSPKKVLEVTNILKGISAKEALVQLRVLEKKVGPILYKFLRGCMLNAENVHGMNADRLLIRECYVNREKYVRRLRFHGRAKLGIQHKKKVSVVVKLVEVPEIEGEHRLGRYGWTNKTWAAVNENLLGSESVEAEEIATPEENTTTYEPEVAEPVEVVEEPKK